MVELPVSSSGKSSYLRSAKHDPCWCRLFGMQMIEPTLFLYIIPKTHWFTNIELNGVFSVILKRINKCSYFPRKKSILLCDQTRGELETNNKCYLIRHETVSETSDSSSLVE